MLVIMYDQTWDQEVNSILYELEDRLISLQTNNKFT